MNKHSDTKNLNTPEDQEIPDAFTGKLGDMLNIEQTRSQDSDPINLDDAIDDDNDNPVGQTLINAAENTGEEHISENKELDGEAQEDIEK